MMAVADTLAELNRRAERYRTRNPAGESDFLWICIPYPSQGHWCCQVCDNFDWERVTEYSNRCRWCGNTEPVFIIA